MSYPTLAPNYTWYKSATKRSSLTKINVVNSYIPTGGESETWNADTNDSGGIKCYIVGTELIIAGNGTGGIYANADSMSAFSNYYKNNDFFSNVTEINGLELLDTSNVTNMESMFEECNKVESLNVAGWDTGNVTVMTMLFYHCYALQNVDVSNWNVASVTAANQMFNTCAIRHLDLSKWDISGLTSLRRLFYNCSALISVDVRGWDTSKVTNMNGVFYGCSRLETLHLNGWSTDSVTDMHGLFNGCTNLKRIYVSQPWNLGSLPKETNLFAGCNNLIGGAGTTWSDANKYSDYAVIDNGGSAPGYFTFLDDECLAEPHKIWMIADSVRAVTGKDSALSMSDIVADVGTFKPYLSARRSWYKSTSMDIAEITEIHISDSYATDENTTEQWNADSLDTGAIKCYRVGTVLYIVGKKIYLNADSAEIFSGMTALTTIDGLDLLDSSEVESLASSFCDDSALAQIDISSWNMSKVSNVDSMFGDCHSIVEVKLGNGLTAVGSKMFYKCTHLENISGLSAVTTIGARAFCHAPVLVSVDMNGQLITYIDESACRSSNIEDCVDLSMVPLANVGNLATRLKRWGADQLATIRATKPSAVPLIDVPNADYQKKYGGTYGPDKNGTYLTISEGACRAFAIYHICNAKRRLNGETPYANWEDWWNSAVENAYTGNGTFSYNAYKENSQCHIDSKPWLRHLLSASALYWANGEAIPTINITTEANSKADIIAHLAATGLPLYVSVPSTNTSGRHAVVVNGYDPVTDKMAICDSSVYGMVAVTNWYKFEDIFSAPYIVDGAEKKDSYYDIVSNPA